MKRNALNDTISLAFLSYIVNFSPSKAFYQAFSVNSLRSDHVTRNSLAARNNEA